MLNAATLSLESNVALALVHDAGGENDRKLIAPAVAAYINLHGQPELAAAQASREAGNAPNAVLAAAAAIVGPKRQEAARTALKFMIERFHAAGLGMEFGASLSEDFDVAKVDAGGQPGLTTDTPDARAQALIGGRRSAWRPLGVPALAQEPAWTSRPKRQRWPRSRPRWPGGRCRASASRAPRPRASRGGCSCSAR